MGDVKRWVRAVIRRLRRITGAAVSSQALERPDRPRFAASEREQPVAWWTERLWAGYDVQALAALHRWSREPTAKASVRAGSFLQMARWYLARGDAEQAYEYAVLARTASGNMPPQREQPAVEVDALTALGRLDEAAAILELAISRRPDDVDLRLRRANVTHDVERRLQVINEVLLAADLAPIRCDGGLTLDGLTADGVDASDGETDASLPLVSVIVPAYNAEGTLATALKSLQAQTWAHIEIIVVDDASTDGTVEVAQRFAATDRRVRVVALDKNRGAYAARNAGLTAARGDFVTVHDADDWSHPAKIAGQMEPLLRDADLLATISEWVRVDDKFDLSWSMRPATRLVHRNYSSLLLRREVIERVGPWDEVRALGDVEMFERIGAVYGPDAVATVLPGVPLSWARRTDSSLTGGSIHAASTRTDIMGARRLYAEAFRWWHGRPEFGAALPLQEGSPRVFPIAPSLGAIGHRFNNTDARREEFDLLLIADLRGHGPIARQIEHWAGVVGEAGRVAMVDLPNVSQPLDHIADVVFELIMRHQVTLVSSADPVTARNLHVVGIGGLVPPPTRLPDVQAEQTQVFLTEATTEADAATLDAVVTWLAGTSRHVLWHQPATHGEPGAPDHDASLLVGALQARGCTFALGQSPLQPSLEAWAANVRRAFVRHVEPVLVHGTVEEMLAAVMDHVVAPHGFAGLENIRTRLLRATRHRAVSDWEAFWSELDAKAYADWRLRHELSNGEIVRLSQRVTAQLAATSTPPSFRVLTIGASDNAPTTASWTHQVGRSGLTGNSHDTEATWTLVVSAGTVLRPAALLLIADTIATNAALRMVLCDAEFSDGARLVPLLKPPTWDPLLARNGRVLWPLVAVRTDLLPRGSEPASLTWHDVLECVGELGSDQVGHVPHVVASADAVEREPVPARAGTGTGEPVIDVPTPSVSVVIPTRDRVELLKESVEGVLKRTDYPSVDLVIVDNGSAEVATHTYLRELSRRDNVKVVDSPGDFNFAALSNLGARHSNGQVIVFLNNDISVLDERWLAAMIRELADDNVAAVGATLLYPDGSMQHAGVALGVGHPVAGHLFRFVRPEVDDPLLRLRSTRRVSAVTAACMAVRREVFESIGGFDADNLAVSYNDVDLCLRLGEAGRHVVVTPFATLVHLESASRGTGEKMTARQDERQRERDYMVARWGAQLSSDAYVNPNTTLQAEDLSIAAVSRAPRP